MNPLKKILDTKYAETIKYMSVYILSGIAISITLGVIDKHSLPTPIWQNYALILSAAIASGLFFLSLKINFETPTLEAKLTSIIALSLTAIFYKNYYLYSNIHNSSDLNLMWQLLPTPIFSLSISIFLTKILTEDTALTKQISIVVTTAMLIVIANATLTNAWIQSTTPQSVQLISLFLMLLVPIGSYFWSINKKTKELSSNSLTTVILVLIKSNWKRKNNLKISLMFLLTTAIVSSVYINDFIIQTAFNMHIFSYILFLIPLTVLLFQESFESIKNTKLQKTAYSFTLDSEKKFLNRHLDQNNIQAINSSSKTCNFSINHDPDHNIAEVLPKTLQYIRTKEIEKCIHTVIEDKFLSCQDKGYSFIGSIDPESSLRPCVDALIMFASIHLDAVSRVEKRLLGLLDLLPVLDPQLIAKLPNNFHEILQNQSPWLYQLDHNWVDQQMIHTEYESSYSISQGLDAHISPEDIKLLLNDKGKHASTFIWISSRARARILVEAPMLNSIIQDHQFKNIKGEDTLVFLIKLEDLIPRLQKYYDLDKVRHRLQDFEPSADSLRFIQLLELQLVNDNNIENIEKLLIHIAEYPWYGFKEKDLALQIIKKLLCPR